MDWINKVLPPRAVGVLERTLFTAAVAGLTYLIDWARGGDSGMSASMAAVVVAVLNAAQHRLQQRKPE